MKKYMMFLVFSIVFLNNYGLANAMPMGGFTVKAIAAQLCPDGSGQWCVAVDRPYNVGFHVRSPGSEIVYGPVFPDYPSVIKLKIVFPPDFDRWGISKSAAILAAYNGDALPEKLRRPEYRGTDYTQIREKLAEKTIGGTAQFYTAVETSSGTSWMISAICVFFISAFLEAGIRFWRREIVAKEFEAMSVDKLPIKTSSLFACLIYPVAGVIAGITIASVIGAIGLRYISHITHSDLFSLANLPCFLFALACVLSLLSVMFVWTASENRWLLNNNGAWKSNPVKNFKKMWRSYHIAALLAIPSVFLICFALFLSAGPKALLVQLVGAISSFFISVLCWVIPEYLAKKRATPVKKHS